MTEQEVAAELAYNGGENAETIDWNVSTTQLRALPAPDGIPFHILISDLTQCSAPNDICVRSYPAYETISQAAAAEWADGTYSQVAAEHTIFTTDLDAVVQVIEEVIARAG